MNRLGNAAGSRAGFTLVELLVVMGIVAILGALSFAGLSEMRSTAGNAACLSNIRQLATAGLLYSADHNSLLPAKNWFAEPGVSGSILGYLPQGSRELRKGVLTCPLLARANRPGTGYGRTYGQNTYAIGSPWEAGGNVVEPYGPTRLAQIPFPSRMIFFGDSLNPKWVAAWSAYDYSGTIGPQGVGSNNYQDTGELPNQRGLQFAFLDGSARRVAATDLTTAGSTSELWRGGYSSE